MDDFIEEHPLVSCLVVGLILTGVALKGWAIVEGELLRMNIEHQLEGCVFSENSVDLGEGAQSVRN